MKMSTRTSYAIKERQWNGKDDDDEEATKRKMKNKRRIQEMNCENERWLTLFLFTIEQFRLLSVAGQQCISRIK